MTDSARAPLPESPFLLERLMRLARRDAEQAGFASEEEFRADLQGRLDDGLQERYLGSLENNPVEMAQELAFQAYECEDETQAVELTEKALELDPRCVDALTLQAFLTAPGAGELIGLLEHAATVAEEDLGEEFFAEFMGDFWPMVEARPYMRCIKQLAEVLWNVGRRLDAVAHYENLLDLDPADHMGNCALLLGYYLSMGEVQRSWDLLEDIDDEVSAVHNWAWVLLFLLVGDEEGARQSLDHALDQNPYVAPLLIGMGTDEEYDLPVAIKTGTEDEAHYCLQVLGEAWSRAEPARWWLFDTLDAMGLVPGEDEDASDSAGKSAH
ncbi:MAG: hypothetical protein ABIK96_02125 [bacterium]|nr:hypothetical protein [bacterium]